MADIVLPYLDDDAPDMFDMADAESISDGDAADLLQMLRKMLMVMQMLMCVHPEAQGGQFYDLEFL
eukprot:CAMPEP_0174377098 /NCGR_PEP_ID=MMETSP0811_2-20130205/120797_1 /TAXON_ID=73025 ORGANISM="Eutreptiella gymnastica-like, Strain CCMP1594" /NCGR_SAMPLE_ID=MMETSP0811_2 /ASSEMBLY_ACC=CAM_ASM_000667 /LENGTH=65 /DNA_ID=CAMNT_0015528999 /DNA_START=161 /DNA_END=357 /DNA_ORIENTATION=-